MKILIIIMDYNLNKIDYISIEKIYPAVHTSMFLLLNNYHIL